MIINPNLLKAGTFVEVIPSGLLCTLKYNSNGILEKVYKETNLSLISENTETFDTSATLALEKLGILPQRINLTNYDTFIIGILHSEKLMYTSAELYKGLDSLIETDIIDNPEEYTFYAAMLSNPIVKYSGMFPIRSRLEVLGFKTLPGFNISQTTSEPEFCKIVNNKFYPFKFPIIQGYFYDKGKGMELDINRVYQTVIKEVKTVVDENGYFKSILHNNDTDILVSYTDVCNYNIKPNTYILVDEYDNLLYAEPVNGNTKERVSREIKCPICGKLSIAPVKGFTTCSDPHCTSKLYSRINQFTNVLGLSKLPYESFLSYSKDGSLTCLSDLLLLDEYKNVVPISCTLSKLLHAIVPIEVCSNERFFEELICNAGSIESAMYYLQNPESIAKDLKLNILICNKLITWLKDPYNSLMCDTIIKCEEIHIEIVERKFEGAPIFRNKTICITGRFRNGGINEIKSILESYEATVVTTANFASINKMSCILVGDLRQEDNEIIQLAQSYNIPIYSEIDFFRSYEIDKDLKDSKQMIN